MEAMVFYLHALVSRHARAGTTQETLAVTQMNSRRMMLGSMAAVAGAGSAALLVQTRATAAAQTAGTAGGDADPVIAEVRQQLKAALAGIQSGSGEAARHAAALVQVWGARIHGRTPDGDLRALAQRAVRRLGRPAVLDTPPNHADIEANVRALGLTTADLARLDLHAPVDSQAKAAALDRLLEGGIQPMLDRTVQMLTLVGDQFDARASVRPVAARQSGCDACIAADIARAEMETFCALAALTPIIPAMAVFVEVCAVFASVFVIANFACWICRMWWG
jgi:hypothetical protein